MKTIQERLASEDYVPALYRKADGSIASYLLTQRMSPEYAAKTDRVKVETPPHLIAAFDVTSMRHLTLKIEQFVQEA